MLTNLVSPETRFDGRRVYMYMHLHWARRDELLCCLAEIARMPKMRVTWIQIHSMSSNLAPIERACITSH